MYSNASHTKPRTLDEAVVLLAAGNARILSGGTDFYPGLGDGVVHDAVVDVSGLRELRGMSRDADCFRIGGLTTWRELEHAAAILHPKLGKPFAGLCERRRRYCAAPRAGRCGACWAKERR